MNWISSTKPRSANISHLSGAACTATDAISSTNAALSDKAPTPIERTFCLIWPTDNLWDSLASWNCFQALINDNIQLMKTRLI
jgi:hypothetical protein